MTAQAYLEGTLGPYHNLVDYILGVTHEIWESRQVERIRDYYDSATLIYTLGGFVRGSDAIVKNTRDTLAAFPDRLLIGDAVIWSRESAGVFYSSHRISSPMTNLGPTAFGPATGRSVVVVTIADCLVEQGVITREWLVRDNYSLIIQLGFDPHEVARRQASAEISLEFARWLADEDARIAGSVANAKLSGVKFNAASAQDFAEATVLNSWALGSDELYADLYAPYAVLHDSRPVASGRAAIRDLQAEYRSALAGVGVAVDHLCVRDVDDGVFDVAARWMLRGQHVAPWLGVPATHARLLVLGVTHWRIVAGRIASEWTIFDRSALMMQMYRSLQTN
jgi:predicted ester cyclase